MPSGRLRGPCSPRRTRRKSSRIPTYVPAHYPARERGCQRSTSVGLSCALAASSGPDLPRKPRAFLRPSTGGSGRGSATPAGGRATRRSRCASARSSSRTPRGPTSSRPSTSPARGPAFLRCAAAPLRVPARAPHPARRARSASRRGGCARSSTSSPSEYGGPRRGDASAGARRACAEAARGAGIGPETADSIALYAAGHPVFVVDAYTRRVFSRLGLVRGDETYDGGPALLQDSLPRDAALYNDYHAQIVRLGKDVCRPRRRYLPLEWISPRSGLSSAIVSRAVAGRRDEEPRAASDWRGDGGVTVSTGTTTPRDAGRACLPAR